MTRTPEDHLAAVRELVGTREITDLPPAAAVGRTLARAVAAVEDSPRFDNSQMDGYALGERHLAGGSFPVGPTIAAGHDPDALLPAGVTDAVVPVMTGARLPAGTAAVVKVETCTPPEFGAAETAGRVTVPAAPAGQFVRPRGSDIAAGSELLPAGHVVNPRTVGVAAAQGITGLPVRRPARVLLCTGGDEISAAEESGSATIRDANGPLLAALCARHGITVAGHVRTSDDPAVFRALLHGAVTTHRPDAVITSGGISHGRFEVVRQVLGEAAGASGTTGTAWFGHVAQQPGGPQGCAVFAGVPVVCLPGNPVSTAVSFRLFVAPALGEAPASVTAVVDRDLTGLPDKDQFLRAVLSVDVTGRLTASPVGGAGSHLLAQSVTASALLRVPAGAQLSAGRTATVYPL
ncbi:MAG TPA: molybdopterin molybdenumtransferase MoeA [Corynebacterium nuruki]|uniref:Molybdopterin molybdenumtransferase n=1 Tax=Corynebacterium nuruki TaxID=1032851 RepID=A0A3D4SYL9_9CORY|nr:molybdopterin molybdenumtransferase MoeA [Corynebacterium nuruki]